MLAYHLPQSRPHDWSACFHPCPSWSTLNLAVKWFLLKWKSGHEFLCWKHSKVFISYKNQRYYTYRVLGHLYTLAPALPLSAHPGISSPSLSSSKLLPQGTCTCTILLFLLSDSLPSLCQVSSTEDFLDHLPLVLHSPLSCFVLFI